nr:MAG: putative RNA-dependent RNA polymerase [Enontekio quenyavirus]
MRLRDAKRLIRFKYMKNQIPFNYWSEIAPYDPELTKDPKKDKYRCVIKTRGARLVRVHICAYHLIRIVAEVVVDNYLAKFQRQPVIFRPMSNPLSKGVQATVEEYGLEIAGVFGYRHFRPQPLSALPREHPEVTSCIQAELDAPFRLPDSLKQEIDQYEHSSLVKDITRMAPSMVCLGEKPPKDFDVDVAFDIFIDEVLSMPFQQDCSLVVHQVPEFSVAEMSRQPQTNSACGLMALSIIDGVTTGTKKDMHDSAMAVNLQDKLGEHVPPFLPYKPALKGEVIKKGKKVRTILLESQPNYMVLKHFYGPLASEWADPAGGVAIGMSSQGGDFKCIPYSWWMESDLDHDEFLDWLATQDAHESDKTSWEASTNATDGVPFLLSLLMRVDHDPRDSRLLARALADYICPHVQYDIGKVYRVWWRVPSGSFLTAYGNSRRHRSMARWVLRWMAQHGAAGSSSCRCNVCAAAPPLVGWGDPVTDLQLRIGSRFFVLGDDFIGLTPSPEVFDWVLDYVFGTTTKTVVRPFFSVPGLEEPTGVEFLRRHFYLDRAAIPFQVRTFRAPGRVLGKLFNGGHRGSKERFLSAVDSAMADCGYNELLFRILLNMHYIIAGDGAYDLSKYRDALQEYIRKSPLIEIMALGYVPTFTDIVNLDANIYDPLLAVKHSDACAALGLTPGQFVSLSCDA